MASRVDNLEKRKKKVIRKSLSKMKKAGEAGKDKKVSTVAKSGGKKIKRLNKKIDKSKARQEERVYGGRVKTSGMRKKVKAERQKKNKEYRAELKAYPQQVLNAAKQVAGFGKDKSVPQKVLKSVVREAPGTYVKGARDAATKTKKLVQKGVKAAGKGAKKVVSKVKNRKKKNR